MLFSVLLGISLRLTLLAFFRSLDVFPFHFWLSFALLLLELLHCSGLCKVEINPKWCPFLMYEARSSEAGRYSTLMSRPKTCVIRCRLLVISSSRVSFKLLLIRLLLGLYAQGYFIFLLPSRLCFGAL